MIDVNKAIATVVRTGKVSFGVESALQNAKTGKAKLIVISANCPQATRQDIEYYCKLSNIPLVNYDGSSSDLAAACGKPFAVSALSIREFGDSEIIKLVEETREETEQVFGGT